MHSRRGLAGAAARACLCAGTIGLFAGARPAQEEPVVRPGTTKLHTSVERETALRFRADPAEPFTLLVDSFDADVGLALETLDGRLLAADEDSGIETNARLAFRIEEPGEVRLRIRARSERTADVIVSVLRGEPAAGLRDEAGAARAYWQRAWSQAIEREEGERAELALERLAALDPGTARGALEESLFTAEDCRLAALAPLADGEAAFAVDDSTRARVALESVMRSLGALASRATDALLLDVLQRAFELASDLQDVPAQLALSERAHAHLRVAREACDPEAMLLLYHRGMALHRASQAAAALPFLEEAHERWSKALQPEAKNVRLARSEYAVVLAQTGRATLAKPLLEQTHAECQRFLAPDDPELLVVRLNLATVSAALGEAETARALGESLLDWTRSLPPDDERHYQLLVCLAGASKAAGRYADGRRYMEEALTIAARGAGPDDPKLLMTRMNLASLRHLDGDPRGAREVLEPAVEALERAFDEREVALQIARSNLAAMRREAGDLAGAIELQDKALAALAGLEDFSLTARVLGERCLTLAALGAAEALEEALATLARVLAVQYGRTAYLGLGEAASARAALSSELGTLLSLVPDSAPGLRRKAFELVEGGRALALGDAVRRSAISEDAELSALARRVAVAREDAARAADALRVFGSPPGAMDRLLAAARERDGAERALAEALEKSGAPLVSVETTALARRLARGTAAVSFVRFAGITPGGTPGMIVRRDEFLAFVLLGDGTLRRVPLGPAQEIEEAIRAWRRALGRPLPDASKPGEGPLVAGGTRSIGGTRSASSADLGAAGDGLRARVLDPVLAALPEDVRALELCPDDVLNLVPLDALPFRGGVLGDRLRVEVLPCLGRLLQEAPAVGAAGVAVLAGGIAYGAEAGETPALPALPGTVAELEAVAGHLRTLADVRVESLTGAAATKAAFVSAVPRARFVHVATHGYALGQGGEDEVAGLLPLASCGLAFAGVTRANGTLAPPESLLTAEELAGLDLTRAELVVLSACDTRVGLRRAGQALQSLETALAIAGARASLTSVWPVDDAAAQGLMAEFYRRLVAPGETPSTALWEAKRSLRSKGAPLADWAGWTLSGTVGQR